MRITSESMQEEVLRREAVAVSAEVRKSEIIHLCRCLTRDHVIHRVQRLLHHLVDPLNLLRHPAEGVHLLCHVIEFGGEFF
jgi:hypothetical protein